LEFHQPAIVAEALAQLSVHPDWMAPLFYGAEEAAKVKGESIKTLPSLLDEIRQDATLSTAAEWKDGNKIRDGILVRAPDEAIHYASQWTVTEQNLEAKTVEMINTAVYFTATAQHPPKQVKIDFYFMHCVNASIFWATFNKLPWLSIEAKIRLLEWKGRNDLVMYASRRSPPLLLEEVTGYVPKEPEASSSEFKDVVKRLFDFEDDGHAIKLLRAVAYGEAVSGKYGSEDWCKIKEFMWLKVQNMVVDSVEDEVRYNCSAVAVVLK
jgi:Questin oxidase-like